MSCSSFAGNNFIVLFYYFYILYRNQISTYFASIAFMKFGILNRGLVANADDTTKMTEVELKNELDASKREIEMLKKELRKIQSKTRFWHLILFLCRLK